MTCIINNCLNESPYFSDIITELQTRSVTLEKNRKSLIKRRYS